jgi:signal peptidase I
MNFISWIKTEDQSWKSFFLELILLLALVLFIRFYIFQFFRVSGPSMCPTLNQFDENCYHGKGEFIFVNEFLYSFKRAPKRGEIVVFRPPTSKKNYIKRVIGVPGDIVEVIDGKVYLTGDDYEQTELPESYLSEKNKGRTFASLEKFIVPDEEYLLFGDNRLESLDSRRCFERDCNNSNSPFVSVKKIRGRAEFVVWPITKTRRMFHDLFSTPAKIDTVVDEK